MYYDEAFLGDSKVIFLDQIPAEWKEDSNLRETTKAMCSCGKLHTLLHQRDDQPEYYSYITLKCDCGFFIGFKIPVN